MLEKSQGKKKVAKKKSKMMSKIRRDLQAIDGRQFSIG